MSSTDRPSFESIFTRYHPMVTQVCRGFAGKDPTVASDLAQEVFINIWRALEKFEGRSSLKTWIYRITVNTCLQYKRKKQGTRQLDIVELTEPSATTEDSESQSDHKTLYQAIDTLGKVDRLIIMMVLDELEYEEIAEVIGITEANLRVKIHRIKKKLKKILSDEG